MSSPEGHQTTSTSTEESKPSVSTGLEWDWFCGDDGNGTWERVEVWKLLLTGRCTECAGGGETCATKYWKKEEPNFGYVHPIDLQPTEIDALAGLEEFILGFPESRTPLVEVSGDFCQLMDTTKKVLEGEEVYVAKEDWKETVHSIALNMQPPSHRKGKARSWNVDLVQFLKNLCENRMGEPPVKFERLREDALSEDTRSRKAGYFPTAEAEIVAKCPLILTVDVFPRFLGMLRGSDDDETQEWKLDLSDDERNNIDATVARIKRLIKSCQVTIFKAITPAPAPSSGDPAKKSDEDLVMVNIQELEQGLQQLAEKKADGVSFHWGLQNPLHGYNEPEEGQFTPYLYEEMVPRSRVEELRRLNKGWCECFCYDAEVPLPCASG
ncbi:hypothetical protein QBC45DRAFT_459759 [Copromyces sp. CBS 386.78]|nr:hypothetical protein QBC45DRAFT_459759 [Copromyces sp. CBS 386.78]